MSETTADNDRFLERIDRILQEQEEEREQKAAEAVACGGFRDRVLTSEDQAWWGLWHERKADLIKAGFSIDKIEDKWMLTYRPRKAEIRSDPALEAKRAEAWRVHDRAVSTLEAAQTAERAAFMRARRLYTADEWLKPLADEALAALGMGEPTPTPLDPLPAGVVELAQVRARRRIGGGKEGDAA